MSGLKQYQFMTSQFPWILSLGTQLLCGYSALCLTSPKQQSQQDCFSYRTLQETFCFQAHLGYWQNLVPCGCRTVLYTSFLIVDLRPSLPPKGPSQDLVLWPLHLRNQKAHLQDFSHCISVASSLCCFFLVFVPVSPIFQGSSDYTEPKQITQDDLPISKPLNSITSSKTLLPSKAKYSQVPRIRQLDGTARGKGEKGGWQTIQRPTIPFRPPLLQFSRLISKRQGHRDFLNFGACAFKETLSASNTEAIMISLCCFTCPQVSLTHS